MFADLLGEVLVDLVVAGGLGFDTADISSLSKGSRVARMRNRQDRISIECVPFAACSSHTLKQISGMQ